MVGFSEQTADAGEQIAPVGGEGQFGDADLFHFYERVRVFDGVTAQGYGNIVAAMFPLVTDLAANPPNGRMVEQQRLDGGLDETNEIVVAADMRKLIGEEGADLRFGESSESSDREKDIRTQPADNSGNFSEACGVEADSSGDAEAEY